MRENGWHHFLKKQSLSQYLNDVQRQRDLERCGSVFWRIRESSFYHNKNQALSNLWKALVERGIYPRNNNQKEAVNLNLINLEKKIAPFMVVGEGA